ncbi:ATP-binding protein [Candidatus Pseudothioglobus singularis]|nr:ATP-binding protein [Candidatus Pseudothioglobus singularis]MDB4598670.1 ATP-binding protein [Candidatus Pseudothioglobus singularis]
MKRFKLNIGTKLFLLYFIVSSSLLWLFAQRTTFESAKSIMVEVSSLMSRVASQNNNDGEIDLETFETLIVNYLRSQRNTIDTNSPQKLENLAIYVTDKDGLLVLDSRGLTLGTDMRAANEVESALSGMIDSTSVVTEKVAGAQKARGVVIEYFLKSRFLNASNPIYGDNGEIIGTVVVVAPLIELMGESYLLRFIFYIFVISLLFGFLGSYRISRNINRVQKYTSNLFSGEDVLMPDLNNQFNKLATTIKDARADVELKDDVEQYIDTLAHELRTPITGIQLTAENLLSPMSDAQRKRFVENILESNKHMDLLVNRLLDLSRIERREALKNVETLSIKETVNTVLKEPSRVKTILDKDLNIDIQISSNATLKAEKILLVQAIGNIVNNALDFTPASGKITIKASQTNSAISIIVLDDGPGIPPQVINKLFTRFFSVTRPDTGVRGNGLGLRFVRKIMKLHGGEVSLQNRFIQQGAEARLRFPLIVK